MSICRETSLRKINVIQWILLHNNAEQKELIVLTLFFRQAVKVKNTEEIAPLPAKSLVPPFQLNKDRIGF